MKEKDSKIWEIREKIKMITDNNFNDLNELKEKLNSIIEDFNSINENGTAILLNESYEKLCDINSDEKLLRDKIIAELNQWSYIAYIHNIKDNLGKK